MSAPTMELVMAERDGWEVIGCVFSSMDYNWRCTVAKSKSIKEVFFYVPVKLGDIVSISDASAR